MILIDILTNKIFLAPALAWVISFLIKFILNYKKYEISPTFLLVTGGMPSSHSAYVTALTLAIGFTQGFNSPLFIVTMLFSVIIIHDAFNIRGRIDQRIREICIKVKLPYEHKEGPIGHTSLEVIAGIGIGVVVAAILFIF